MIAPSGVGILRVEHGLQQLALAPTRAREESRLHDGLVRARDRRERHADRQHGAAPDAHRLRDRRLLRRRQHTGARRHVERPGRRVRGEGVAHLHLGRGMRDDLRRERRPPVPRTLPEAPLDEERVARQRRRDGVLPPRDRAALGHEPRLHAEPCREEAPDGGTRLVADGARGEHRERGLAVAERHQVGDRLHDEIGRGWLARARDCRRECKQRCAEPEHSEPAYRSATRGANDARSVAAPSRQSTSSDTGAPTMTERGR